MIVRLSLRHVCSFDELALFHIEESRRRSEGEEEEESVSYNLLLIFFIDPTGDERFFARLVQHLLNPFAILESNQSLKHTQRKRERSSSAR